MRARARLAWFAFVGFNIAWRQAALYVTTVLGGGHLRHGRWMTLLCRVAVRLALRVDGVFKREQSTCNGSAYLLLHLPLLLYLTTPCPISSLFLHYPHSRSSTHIPYHLPISTISDIVILLLIIIDVCVY